MKPHGHPTRYHSGCRCLECKEARRIEGKRERAKVGKDRMVSAELVRRRVRRFGWPVRAVARAAGLHYTTLDKLMKGKKSLRLSISQRILQLQDEDVQPFVVHHFIDAKETKQLVLDLEQSGLTHWDLGRKLGVKSVVVRTPRVRIWNAKRIEQMYRKLGTAA